MYIENNGCSSVSLDFEFHGLTVMWLVLHELSLTEEIIYDVDVDIAIIRCIYAPKTRGGIN